MGEMDIKRPYRWRGKQWYWLVTVLMAVFSLIALTACQGEKNKTLTTEEKKLVVYTSEREELMDAIIPLFEEKYGIQVHLVQGESAELLERIKTDGMETEADVLMGVSLSDVSGSESLFLEYVSVNDKYLLESYQNSQGYATSYVLNGCCLIVNKTMARDYTVEGYEDLLHPELKGKIIMADPATSSTGFAQLINILEVSGGYEDEDAWQFVYDLLNQTSGYATSSKDVYTRVAKGEYIVGLSHEDAAASLMQQGADVRIVYPAEGALYVPRVAVIVKNGRHGEYAKHFVDFIAGKDMQDIFGTLLSSRPVRQDAKLNQYLKDMDTIHVITEDEEYLNLCKTRIWEHYKAMMKKVAEKD